MPKEIVTLNAVKATYTARVGCLNCHHGSSNDDIILEINVHEGTTANIFLVASGLACPRCKCIGELRAL